MKPETGRLLIGAGGVAGLVMAIAFLVGWGASGGMRRAMGFPPAFSSEESHVHMSEAAQRVASGLKCPCGCPDLLLACGCTNRRGAAEVKGFIMDQLANGRSESEVRVELINRYGAAIQRIAR